MENLELLVEASEKLKQDVKYTRFCEMGFSANDSKLNNRKGFNANTQDFRKYAIEIVDMANKLLSEMDKIYDLVKKRLGPVLSPENIDNSTEEKFSKIYGKLEYKVYMCLKVYLNMAEIYKGLPEHDKAELSDTLIGVDNQMRKLIVLFGQKAMECVDVYGTIYKFDNKPITAEYFTFDNFVKNFSSAIQRVRPD